MLRGTLTGFQVEMEAKQIGGRLERARCLSCAQRRIRVGSEVHEPEQGWIQVGVFRTDRDRQWKGHRSDSGITLELLTL